MNHVIVLGAGPAGLSAAVELAKAGVQVTLIERQNGVGGNASSFSISGVSVDFGSHRLHPASDPQVMERIRGLLGDDLLTRPRHGRIRLMGRWIHFPLRPVDLLLRMHPRFGLGVATDMLSGFMPKVLRVKAKQDENSENFGSILRRGLGKTICEEFYFPYSRKIWGVEPEELSALQAYKRVSAGSIGKMLRRLLPGGASGGANTRGIFYYPRHGYGQICNAFLQEAQRLGVNVLLGSDVQSIDMNDGKHVVTVSNNGKLTQLSAQQVYSTIPLTQLAKLVKPTAPQSILAEIEALQFRSMVLVYLELKQDQFTEYDAHYFPALETPFSRVSETKNYSDRSEPRGTTVLCAEVPCFKTDDVWAMSEEEMGELVANGLALVGLPIESPIVSVTLRRLPFAYPLYRKGYEASFERLDNWLSSLDGVLSFGRQGLYAHDNTHHAIYMAIEAARCLQDDGTIDVDAWKASRKVFESHVVED